MITETIRNRRALYPDAFNNQPIPRKEIEQVLETANWAPTHKRTEPWRFKIFYTEESREKLAAFLGTAYAKSVDSPSDFKQKKMEQKALRSGCVIAICMQRDPKERIPEWEEIASVAMAVQNMLLTAHHLRIGTYWSSPALINYFGEHVSLDEGERCLGFMYMGKYDGELPEGTRNSTIDDKTEWL